MPGPNFGKDPNVDRLDDKLRHLERDGLPVDTGQEIVSLPGPPVRAAATSRYPGVSGESALEDQPGVSAWGAGVGLEASGEQLAAHFKGNVTVTGILVAHQDIQCPNADCAEEFDVAHGSCNEPGTVMVLDPDGRVRASRTAYDNRVAGVVSGAGAYRPAITLDARTAALGRLPVALMGKVYCRVDATEAAIETGDLLTTSTTMGCAMKASDRTLSFGAVIGKALAPLTTGVGLIPILVALQ